MFKFSFLVVICGVILILLFRNVQCCNEATCGSIVSKCLLTESCNCDLKARTCSRECFTCLGYLYTECCSCLDMCPKAEEEVGELGKKSHVEDFIDPVPQLFQALTEYPDQMDQWVAKTIPMDIKYGEDTAPMKPKVVSVNCTVVFWAQCVTWKKCKSSCLSMGANSYRWFHDGCCECVGQDCVNYGLKESKCRDCPDMNANIINEEEDDFDYGEDEMMEYEEM